MLTKNNLRVAVLLLVFALLLGALPTLAQDRTQVVWYIGLGAGGQPQQIEAQEAVRDAFNASQDEIELVINIVDNTVAYDTLSTLIATGQAPDIIGPVGLDGSNAFAGQYLDLQPLIDSTGYDLSQFDEAAVDSYRIDGQGLIGLPFATFPSFIWYRRDLFDEAGLNYPPTVYGEPYVMPDGTEVEWNMDTLREVAMMLTVDAEGFDASMEEFDAENTIQWGFIHQYAEPRGMGTFFGSGSAATEEGNAEIPEPWRASWNWMYDGIWTDQFYPSEQEQQSDLLGGNPFGSGNIAMAHTHLWYTCCVNEVDDWDFAVSPSYNGVITNKLHGDTFRIMKSTQNPEAAFEVLTYLLGEASDELLLVYGGLPAREDQQGAFLEALAENFPQGVNWGVAIDSLAYADSPNHEAPMPNYLRSKDRIGQFQTLMQGTPDLDISAEIDQLEADLQALFDEAGNSIEAGSIEAPTTGDE